MREESVASVNVTLRWTVHCRRLLLVVCVVQRIALSTPEVTETSSFRDF